MMKHFWEFYVENILLVAVILGHVNRAPAQQDPAASPPDPSGGAAAPAAGGGAAAPAASDPAAGGANNASTAKVFEEVTGPAPWLRICQPGAGKSVGLVSAGGNDCPAGYWFKDKMKIGCACGHGVWAFAQGWCDHSAKIIVARNGSCFNVNKEVRYVRHIGWASNAFRPFHFQATTGFEYIQSVPEPSVMAPEGTFFNYEYNQHIGAVNKMNAIESMTGRVCYSPGENQSAIFSMKYFSTKLPFVQKLDCFAYAFQDLSRLEYDASYQLNEGLSLVDEMQYPFEKPKSWATPADVQKCASECPPIPGPYSKNNSIGPDYIDPILDDYFLEEIQELGYNDSVPLPTSLPEQNCTRHYTLTDKTVLEIQEQTKRILQINLMSSVQDAVSPGVRYPDYRLLQKARAILDEVCPEDELPTAVLTGMLRMFRVVVNESFYHYPYNQHGSENETAQILEILDKCKTEAKPMTFVYDNGNQNESVSGGNDTVGNDTVTPEENMEKCKTGLFIGVDYQFNETLNRTILTRMPCHLKSNITDLDLVVETAWKTVMFTHYYCARHFKDEKAALFSSFEQKLEKFFNRWIQHRWYYPGTSNRGYSYLYGMFNLTNFVLAIDRCVAAARSFSVYNKWLKRPVYLKYLGEKLFEEQYEIPDKIAGRTQLDPINPKLNQFNKKAYCLPYWHAPASNPGLNYNPDGDYKEGCVKYRREEWENPFTPKEMQGQGWKNSIRF